MGKWYMGYDYDADGVSFKVGQFVNVLQSEAGGWALVKTADEAMVWVPTDFIKVADADPVMESNPEYASMDQVAQQTAANPDPTYDTVVNYGRQRLHTLSQLQAQASAYSTPTDIGPVYEEIPENKEGIYEEIAEVKRRDVGPSQSAATTASPAATAAAGGEGPPGSVQGWLESIGLERYADTITAIPHYNTLEACSTIDEDDALNEFCISDSRAVSALVDAARKLKATLAAAAQSPPQTATAANPTPQSTPAVAAAPQAKKKPPPPGRTTSLQPAATPSPPPPAAVVQPPPGAVEEEPAAVEVELPPPVEQVEQVVEVTEAAAPPPPPPVPREDEVGLVIEPEESLYENVELNGPDPILYDAASPGGPPPTPPLRADMQPLDPSMVGTAAPPPADTAPSTVDETAEVEIQDNDEGQPGTDFDAENPEGTVTGYEDGADDIYENTPGAVRSNSVAAVHANLPAGPRKSVKQRTQANMFSHPMLQTPSSSGRHDSTSSQWSLPTNDDDDDDGSETQVVKATNHDAEGPLPTPPTVATFNVPAPPPPRPVPSNRLSVVAEAPDDTPAPASRGVPKVATKAAPQMRSNIERGAKERASIQALRKSKVDTSGVKNSIAAALAAGPQFVPTSGGLKSSNEEAMVRKNPAAPKAKPPVTPRRKHKPEELAKIENQIMIEQRVLDGANKVLEAYAKKGKIPKKGSDAETYKKAQLMATDALGRLESLREALKA
eukprot:m.458687 g.458687  ORF g.458687 m.458687 type:complete len:726 (+) comp21564_c0_seq1:221-2398(+)